MKRRTEALSGSVGSASAELLHLLLAVAREHGFGAPRLSAGDPRLRAILERPSLYAPGARLAIDELLEVCARVHHHLGHRALGVDLARQVRPATFSALGYALMTCATLGDAIGLAPHFRQLVFDLGYSTMRLVDDDECLSLRWQTEAGVGHRYSPLLAEALLCAWTSLARWMTSAPLSLREVHFAHHPASVAAQRRYREFFGCPVRFASAHNALCFDPAQLSHRLRRADAELHLMMRAEASAALRRLRQRDDDSVAASLRRALVPALARSEATLTQIARRLDLAPRSLQRQLAVANTSFQEVLDELRQEWATLYLRDESLSLGEIALLLGYAEQSSFTRAFRAWRGITPLAWRKAQRA